MRNLRWLAFCSLAVILFDNAAAQQPDCGTPVADPNFPADASQTGLPLRWRYTDNPTIPEVHINAAVASGDTDPVLYLGFNENGAWLSHRRAGGRVYLWNLHTQKLSVAANALNAVATETVMSWRNQPDRVQWIKWINPRVLNDRAAPLRPKADPNIPCLIGRGPGIEWNYMATGAFMAAEPTAAFPPGHQQSQYLGFNEEGAWFQLVDERSASVSFVIWNRARGTVKPVAGGLDAVPANLSSPSGQAFSKALDAIQNPRPAASVAKAAASGPGGAGSADAHPAAPNPAIEAKRAAVLAGAKLAASQAPAAAGPVHGAAASVTNGVLTFTVNDAQSADNGKQKSYRVARPNSIPAGALPGDTGPWISQDGAVLFLIQGDHSVTGNPVPGNMGPALQPAAK